MTRQANQQTSSKPLELSSVGPYRVLDKLGEGGMGTVYKALHTKLKRVVALKVLPVDRMKDPQAIARFEREMEAAGKLDHPNIVRASDANEEDGLHYLVMEYVDGEDLSQLVARHGTLQSPDACEIIRQAAEGLQNAHEHGLVHRDIKPSNLMLTADGQVKILDLGLALLDSHEGSQVTDLTTPHQAMGTLDYMAREQGDDSHEVDIRADIYSLGATLYKLLAGEPPFGARQYNTPIKKLMALANETPPSIAERCPNLPETLVYIVDRMLAKQPEDRFQTPKEVAIALQPYVAGCDLPSLLIQVPNATSDTDEVPRTTEATTTESRSSALAETKTLAKAADQPPHASPLRRRRFPKVRTAIGIVISGLISFGIVLYLRDGRQTVKVELDPALIKDATASVWLDGRRMDIAGLGETIKLTAGEHGYEIRRGDQVITAREFAIVKGDNRALRITIEEAAIDAEPDRFDHAPMPIEDQPPPGTVTDATALNGLIPQPAEPAEFDKLADDDIGKAATETETANSAHGINDRKGPRPSSTPLRGLLPDAVEIPGVGRWQIETVHTRGRWIEVAWSPDQQRIACGGSDGVIRIYDAEKLELVQLLSGHNSGVTVLAWSPDGDLLASGSSDNTIRLWRRDGTSGPVLSGHEQLVSSLAWSPDGQQLASSSWDKSIRLWQTDGTASKTIASGGGEIAWSPDGNWIVSSDTGNTLKLLRPDGTPGVSFATEHEKYIGSLAWSPDSQLIASAGGGNLVRLWNADGTPVLSLQDHSQPVKCVRWRPDGEMLATASDDGTIRLWHSDGTPGPVIKERTEGVDWSPDGKRLASVNSGTLWTWNADGSGLAGAQATHYGGQLAWRPQSSSLAIRHDSQIQLISEDGKLGDTLVQHRSLASFAWSPDGKRLATCGDRLVKFWESDGKPGAEVGVADAIALAFAWSPGDQWIAIGCDDGSVKLIRPDGTAGPALQGHESPVLRVAWSPDGSRLASGSNDGEIRLWNADGAPGPVLVEHEKPITSLVWGPNGASLASADQSAAMWLWRVTDQQPVIETRVEFDVRVDGSVTGVAWHPDGTQFATATSGGTVKLWRSNGTAGPVLSRRAGRVGSIAWSPDGRWLATTDHTGITFLWDTETLAPKSTVVACGNRQMVTFDAVGNVIDGKLEAAEDNLVVVLQETDGRVELLKPSEFQTRATSRR